MAKGDRPRTGKGDSMGRGRSGKVSGRGNAKRAFERAGVRFVDEDGKVFEDKAVFAAVEPALKGLKAVLDDFGIPLSEIRRVDIAEEFSSKKGSDGTAGVNGFNILTFNLNSFRDEQTAKAATNSNGYVISDTVHGVGTHEAGHLIVNSILKNRYKDAASLAYANARTKHTLEKEVIRDAKKAYGSSPMISKYGNKSPGETVAEAVSDVYSNGSKANPYSKAIVNVLKRKWKESKSAQ